MWRKRHEKAACNIILLISFCNQLQYLTSLEGTMAVNPVILGGGSPLFKPGERVKLKLRDSKALSTGIVILRYLPATST
jgi:hypothetical protein